MKEKTTRPPKIVQEKLPALAQALVKACKIQEQEATRAKFVWAVKDKLTK